jgi:hypothetical protein
LYVEAIDKDPSIKDMCKEKEPTLDFDNYERVGRNQLHPRLLFETGCGQGRLKKLPYSDQEKYMDSGIECLTANNDILKIKVKDMSPQIAKQVFAYDHVRSIPEQKAFMLNYTPPKVTKVVTFFVDKKKKRLVVNNFATFSANKLRTIIKELETKGA